MHQLNYFVIDIVIISHGGTESTEFHGEIFFPVLTPLPLYLRVKKNNRLEDAIAVLGNVETLVVLYRPICCR